MILEAYEEIEFTKSQINVVARKLHGKELIETMSHKVINKSFGFDTTIEEAQRAINAADVEAQSVENDISLVKLMGHYSDNMLLLSFMHRK
ncbi:ATP-dependent 6-phosphofructokinase 4, chloroplastic [Capsicum chinense]|nr:ATP-dependent 6-phosphofructokinase 4, chloroplastic [Capsicum chinense]